jgi:hypothetical protein
MKRGSLQSTRLSTAFGAVGAVGAVGAAAPLPESNAGSAHPLGSD